ncbi:cardiolipin synthase [Rhodoferax koreense]|uniref:Cardiolipin synthase n=1 Tax=Rhodoferax koreensis TaxID=1842727 RepID=A0A1P8K3T7_9BURK|nr:cardiolipin synthase [Rhodoferax koreense]
MRQFPGGHDGFVTALSAAWGVYIAVLAVWIILEKRAPVSTLSWILSMALLPILGYVVYYFLGPQRLKKHRLKRLRSQAALHGETDFAGLRERASDAPQSLRQLAQLGTAACDLPIATATQVDLLVDGAQAFDAIFEAIRAARHHVHLEYYIFEPDRIGTALRDLLVEKARAGVQVRLLVDALGSKRIGQRFLAPLTEAGAQVGLFHQSRIGRRWRPVINFRTHRKIVVCDGVVGFTGGINITDEEDQRTRPDAYHDVHLRIVGSAVRLLQMTFLEDWVYTTEERPRDIAQHHAQLLPPTEPGSHPVQILTSGPDNPREGIHRMVVAGINAATERVWLTTPYFVPGEPGLMALTSAALRGVDVQVLVPRRSDSAIVSAAARSYFDELIAAGVKVWEYRAGMLHSKTLLIDDNCAFIGTANFDNRSFRLNFEVCAVVYGPVLAEPLARQFTADLLAAKPVAAMRRLPFLRKLGDATARLFSPVL